MTANELKTLLDNTSKEKISPIIEQMAKLICDAYETGVNVGMEVGKGLRDNK